LAVLLTAAGAAHASGPDPVGPPSQSVEDGCQRNIPGILAQTSPEWVYVHSYDAKFVDPENTYLAEGVAHDSHPSEDDLPQGHKAFDLNFNLDVASQYQELLGGDPDKKTGNYAPGEEQGFLHMEWEEDAIPSWAWPTEKDAIKVWGAWIWDCGHWGLGFPDYFVPSQLPYKGPITGERTEFHSTKFVVVTRADPYRTSSNETQADVFASTDGRMSHAQEQCAHEHRPVEGANTYGPDYTACIHDSDKQKQTLNDRDYDFFVPAPRKPSSSATLTYRIDDRLSGGEPSETVTPQSDGIKVTVNFKGSSASHYGKAFYVGWKPAASTPPDHLQVTVNSIKVNRSLDPNPQRTGEQTGQPPGEYNLYMDANGDWQFLNDWVPGLGSVNDGQSFDVNKGVDFYVQSRHGVRILFDGRECDFVGVEPCPQTAELADQNDRPGDALQTFSSVKAALGKHTVQSDLSTPSVTDPTSKPNYEVTYTVSRVKG